jgi:glutaredoxin/glutathione-dependent peroxiredoxin
MSIKVGDRLPETTFTSPSADGPKPVTTQEYFGGRTVVLTPSRQRASTPLPLQA